MFNPILNQRSEQGASSVEQGVECKMTPCDIFNNFDNTSGYAIGNLSLNPRDQLDKYFVLELKSVFSFF